MRKSLKYLLICCLAILLVACQKDKKESETIVVIDSMVTTASLLVDTLPTLDELKSKIDTTKVEYRFTEKDYNKVIPKKVQKYISQNFKNWTYPNASHWEEFWFKNFATDSSLVNFIQGDFNLDKKQDYAFFLENAKEKKIAFILIQGKGKSFETVNFREMSYKGEKPKFDFGLFSLYECDSVKCTRTYLVNLKFEKDAVVGKWKGGVYTETVK